MSTQGTLVISLDFELVWGIHDVIPLENYEANLLGTQQAIQKILRLFNIYDIKATWALVGLLYCQNQQEMLQMTPEQTPTYTNQTLSAYQFLEEQKERKDFEKLSTAPDIITEIAATPNQEIATHTFSHYYTLEKGQTLAQFEADLEAAIQIAKRNEHDITSIVFPRNQIHDMYVHLCNNFGITAYRGNEDGFAYQIEDNEGRRWLKRGLRFLDRYLNLFGNQTYELPAKDRDMSLNIRSSRFLNPYTPRLRIFEGIRLNRIKKAMTHAAINGEVFHLWWHPHNFGKYQEENIALLTEILQHYTSLNEAYHFTSKNMQQLVASRENAQKTSQYN